MSTPMSKFEDDHIEATLAAAAARDRGPGWPPITLTGDQRKLVAAAITDSIAAHQRRIRDSKVRHERMTATEIINSLSRSLAMVDRNAKAGGPNA